MLLRGVLLRPSRGADSLFHACDAEHTELSPAAGWGRVRHSQASEGREGRE